MGWHQQSPSRWTWAIEITFGCSRWFGEKCARWWCAHRITYSKSPDAFHHFDLCIMSLFDAALWRYHSRVSSRSWTCTCFDHGLAQGWCSWDSCWKFAGCQEACLWHQRCSQRFLEIIAQNNAEGWISTCASWASGLRPSWMGRMVKLIDFAFVMWMICFGVVVRRPKMRWKWCKSNSSLARLKIRPSSTAEEQFRRLMKELLFNALMDLKRPGRSCLALAENVTAQLKRLQKNKDNCAVSLAPSTGLCECVALIWPMTPTDSRPACNDRLSKIWSMPTACFAEPRWRKIRSWFMVGNSLTLTAWRSFRSPMPAMLPTMICQLLEWRWDFGLSQAVFLQLVAQRWCALALAISICLSGKARWFDAFAAPRCKQSLWACLQVMKMQSIWEWFCMVWKRRMTQELPHGRLSPRTL